MKKFLTSACLCLLAAAGLQSCLDFNELGNRLNGESISQIPNGALPTEEMTYGNFDEEPYAGMAAKYVINDPQYGIESVELFANGMFLISLTGASQYAASQPASAHLAADGSVTLHMDKKSEKDARMQNAYHYIGYFQLYGADQFFLDSFGIFQFSSQDGTHYTLTVFDNNNEFIFTTDCIRQATFTDRISKEICRSWDIKSWEEWGYLNGTLTTHGSFNGEYGYYEGDFLYNPDDYDRLNQEVRTVIFSPSGTYLSYLNNGEFDVRSWTWSNPSEEKLFCDWAMAGSGNKDGSFTVRFKGKEARFYEDDTYTGQEVADLIEPDMQPYLDEDIESARVIRVTTLRASMSN